MSLSIRIATADLEAVADDLGRIDAAAIQEAATRAVNTTIQRFDVKAKKLMNFGINLTDAYISGRMTTQLSAPAANPSASITTDGDLVILGRYSPILLTAPAPRARGSAKRGIPAGMKASGVSVEVTRGERKTIDGAFLVTLRRGTEAGFQDGVFVRENGQLKHLYGVAPYSLFRATIDAQEQILADDLADEMVEELGEIE